MGRNLWPPTTALISILRWQRNGVRYAGIEYTVHSAVSGYSMGMGSSLVCGGYGGGVGFSHGATASSQSQSGGHSGNITQ